MVKFLHQVVLGYKEERSKVEKGFVDDFLEARQVFEDKLDMISGFYVFGLSLYYIFHIKKERQLREKVKEYYRSRIQ